MCVEFYSIVFPIFYFTKSSNVSLFFLFRVGKLKNTPIYVKPQFTSDGGRCRGWPSRLEVGCGKLHWIARKVSGGHFWDSEKLSVMYVTPWVWTFNLFLSLKRVFTCDLKMEIQLSNLGVKLILLFSSLILNCNYCKLN